MNKRSFALLGAVITVSISVITGGAASAVASLLANFTNNEVAAADLAPNTADNLVLDITIPDAFNGSGATEDLIIVQGTNTIWQGETLNAIPALGAVDGVGYTNVAPNGFQGIGAGEAVIIDHDADSKYTNGPDTLIEADGSATDGVGTMDAAVAAGDPLVSIVDGTTVVTGGFALCTNNRNTPTAIRIDTDSDCTNGTKTEGTYILGTNAQTAGTVANDKWTFGDAVTMGGNGNGTYDDGEDLFIESKKNALTYSAQADTDVYSVGGITNGKNLKDFTADCDKGGAGTQACFYTGSAPIDAGDSIVIDEGTHAGAAPNGVLDKQTDELRGITVENLGTATSEDISELKVWMENGTNPGFLATEDTLLGTMTEEAQAYTTNWWLGSLTQAISAGGARLYVTASISEYPSTDRTIQLSIPVYNDAGSDNAVTQVADKGVFMASPNDGPTDTALTNTAVQTIKVPAKSSPSLINSQTGDSNLDFQEGLEEQIEEEATEEESQDTTTDLQEEENTDGSTVVEEQEEVVEQNIPEEVVTPEPTPETVDSEEGEVLGEQTFAPGELIRGTDMKVYRINEDGTKTHIRSLEELAANHLGQTIFNVADSMLAIYPTRE